MNEPSITRFTYGLAFVTWVLIALGLAWVAMHADERGTAESRATATVAGAVVRKPEHMAPDRPHALSAPPAPTETAKVQHDARH